MHYVWRGQKPHKRHEAIYTGSGRDKKRLAQVRVIEIKPGEPFEPTEFELRSFGDLMEPVGESLRVAAAVHEQSGQGPTAEE
jgi:hypothetical protein